MIVTNAALYRGLRNGASLMRVVRIARGGERDRTRRVIHARSLPVPVPLDRAHIRDVILSIRPWSNGDEGASRLAIAR